ncbi:translation elongation factor Ts [Candidatus Contubernalis alkaliaceticus]|uniref:translation elongation factor Ts n=1 Tax=Candidatus Contubernalis alkaliaceticus TaxID=338645 RepID=UPI001F4BF64D|nr:translation elongation factor Ts [Candidatus Contubernalis alkalaceticus]UNC91826.1 translation elongation factor Ts [Candidatus Contubernalis alkalaceticus]
MIKAAVVKELREKTGAGMMDCKKALVETEGDFEKAVNLLREKGLSAAAKKTGRVTAEGLVDSYVHMGGKIGVLVEVNCETDFVAKNEEFKQFVRDVCMQIAATNPQYISREEFPQEEIEKEREIYRNQALREGKPEKIVEKIVDGRLEKFYAEACLLEQQFIKDTDRKIMDLLKDQVSKVGENISIRRFSRFVMGEGLEKREDNLADEVKAMTSKK